MKKLASIAIAVAMGGTLMLQSGCFGSFALVNKVYDWNKSLSNDKYTQSLVFWVLNIIPVYGASAFVDAVFLNVIEFWSGSNPLSLKAGDHEEQMVVKNGVTYRIEATTNRFTITPLSGAKRGEKTILDFNQRDMSWNCTSKGETQTIATIHQHTSGDPYVSIFHANGQAIQIAAPADESSLAASFATLHQSASAANH